MQWEPFGSDSPRFETEAERGQNVTTVFTARASIYLLMKRPGHSVDVQPHGVEYPLICSMILRLSSIRVAWAALYLWNREPPHGVLLLCLKRLEAQGVDTIQGGKIYDAYHLRSRTDA